MLVYSLLKPYYLCRAGAAAVPYLITPAIAIASSLAFYVLCEESRKLDHFSTSRPFAQLSYSDGYCSTTRLPVYPSTRLPVYPYVYNHRYSPFEHDATPRRAAPMETHSAQEFAGNRNGLLPFAPYELEIGAQNCWRRLPPKSKRLRVAVEMSKCRNFQLSFPVEHYIRPNTSVSHYI
ncbi:hypothetical protein V9T40_013109 [Parthenolecanium corni]|uniref:Uncharacterized protein n=1 Tax=Parthenolecanium corni TaxID=536013 RepID=A0AAN9TWM8_9HEMI